MSVSFKAESVIVPKSGVKSKFFMKCVYGVGVFDPSCCFSLAFPVPPLSIGLLGFDHSIIAVMSIV